MIKISNPDTSEIYDTWHLCKKCLSVYSHSQADWETIKGRECCANNLMTLSSWIKEITIERREK